MGSAQSGRRPAAKRQPGPPPSPDDETGLVPAQDTPDATQEPDTPPADEPADEPADDPVPDTPPAGRDPDRAHTDDAQADPASAGSSQDTAQGAEDTEPAAAPDDPVRSNYVRAGGHVLTDMGWIPEEHLRRSGARITRIEE